MSTPARSLAVTAAWDGGYRCEVTARQHRVVVDEPESAKGTDTGATPTELFLASLGSCFTLAVYHVAAKRGIDLRAVQIEVTGNYSGPSFAALELEVRIDADLDDHGVDDLLARARAVCYVSNTLAKPPPVVIRRRAMPPTS